MIKANVLEAKTHLSRYLDSVEKGEVVVLCRHNIPIAELRRIEREPGQQAGAPEFGLWAGYGVSAGFFEPLDDEVQAGFEGKA